jgi:hypothetical protein
MDPTEVYNDGKTMNSVGSLMSQGSGDWEGFTFEEKNDHLGDAMEEDS